MAALAKKKSIEPSAAWRGRSVRTAHEADQPRPSAVHSQHAMLEAAFSDIELKPYPGPVKVALVVGAPLALWIGLFTVVGRILHG